MLKLCKKLVGFISILSLSCGIALAANNSFHLSNTASKSSASGQPQAQMTRVTINPGSLRSTLTQLGHGFGWSTVVWNVPSDYDWTGTVTLSGANLPDILKQLLQGYPVQAIFYEGNHVLVIQPRTVK